MRQRLAACPSVAGPGDTGPRRMRILIYPFRWTRLEMKYGCHAI